MLRKIIAAWVLLCSEWGVAQQVHLTEEKYVLSLWDLACWYVTGITDTHSTVLWLLDGVPIGQAPLPWRDTVCADSLSAGIHRISGVVFTSTGDTLFLLPAHIYVEAPPSADTLILIPHLPAYCPGTTLTLRVPDNIFWTADTIVWVVTDSSYINAQEVTITLPPTDTSIEVGFRATNLSGMDSVFRVVVVNPSAAPAIYLSVPDSACTGSPLPIVWSVEGGSPLYLTTGDGSTYSQSILYHSYTRRGQYTVTAYGVSHCSNIDSTLKQITVIDSGPLPIRIKRFPALDTLPPHLKLSFWTEPAGALHPLYLLWDFGDGTHAYSLPSDTVEHLYRDEGEYTVSVRAINGCGMEGVDSVRVRIDTSLSPPQDMFSIGSEADTLCVGGQISFWIENGRYLPTEALVLWDFGNRTSDTSTPSQSVATQYLSSGTYTVRATVAAPRWSLSLFRQVIVLDSLGVLNGVLSLSERFICPGEPLDISIGAGSRTKVSIDSFRVWVFADTGVVLLYGGSGSQTRLSLPVIGTYLISAQGWGACSSVVTAAEWIEVRQGEAHARVNAPSFACNGTAVKFSCQTTGRSTCVWIWDDGSPPDTGNLVIHVFDTPGLHTVILAVDGECGADSAFHQVLVEDAPDVRVMAPPACQGSTAHLWVTGNVSGAEILWTLGDGTTDTGMYISHEYDTAGILPLQVLIVTATCQKRIFSTHYISYDTPAVASFTYQIAEDTVYFFNTSSNATFYLWIFGDGATSQQENPVHIYSAPGIYTVMLIARNPCGFADTAIAVILITAEGNPSTTAEPLLPSDKTIKTFPSVLSLSKNLEIYLLADWKTAGRCKATLFHLSGKAIQTWEVHETEKPAVLQLPAGMQEGLYLLRVTCSALNPYNFSFVVTQ